MRNRFSEAASERRNVAGSFDKNTFQKELPPPQ
jgi:hypothetical protein